MKEKVRKYFMAGTDDEVHEGDVIEVTLVGEEDGVMKHTHLELKFRPEFAKDLIEEEIIEEREVEEEVEEEEDLLEFDDDFREAVSQGFVELDERVASLEKRVAKLEESVATIKELIRLMKSKKEEKPTSFRKK